VQFGKGCYVGQEVVEKIEAVGRVPRKLARIILKTKEAPLAGTPVLSSAAVSVGRFLSSAFDTIEESQYAFALVKNGQLEIGDTLRVGNSEGVVLEYLL